MVGETGTSTFGLGASRLPKSAVMYHQPVFGSIGYATPSTFGAFQAAMEHKSLNRGILVTDEESLQLVAMAFADASKLGIKPIVFVLDNNGYTVER